MTAPQFADCRCSHPWGRHEGALAPQCTAKGCTCLQYRPNVVAAAPTPAGLAHTPPAARPPLAAVPTPAVAPPGGPPTVEQLVAAGRRSSNKRIAALAEKFDGIATDLADRLRAERVAVEEKARAAREAEEARRLAVQARAAVEREVAELENRLKAAKQKLRSTPAKGFKNGRTPPAPTRAPQVAAPVVGTHACTHDGCDRTFDSAQAVAMHRRRAHEGFDPNAAKAV